MPKRQFALSIILFLVSQFAYPNFKLLPGYYINLNGDSVHCNIEIGNWNINPGSIQVQVNNSVREFGPQEIKGFGVSGYGDYIAATVTFHTNPVSGEDLPKNYSDNTESKLCFIKVLRKNVYSLYLLAIPARDYLFISYPDKTFTELVYRAKRSNDSLSEDQSYRNQILALFANEGISQKYFTQISEISYSGMDIGPLIDILNQANTGVKIIKKPGKLRFEVFAGILLNSFPSTFDANYTLDNQFKSQITPTFGLNLLYPLPGKYLKVGLSVGYNGYHCTINNSGSYQIDRQYYHATTEYTETITTSNSLLSSNLYVMYLINPLSSTRFYVKGGINYYFSFAYNKNGVNLDWERTENGIENGTIPTHYIYGDNTQIITVKNYFITFKCAAGVNFGRGSLELSYVPPTQLATSGEYVSPTDNKTDFKLTTIGICYYFTLFH
jgi:hypothetical protein